MFVLEYGPKLQKGRDIIDCSVSTDYQRERRKCCRVDLDAILGPCTVEKDFGYEDGQPCLLLKMNRVRTEPIYNIRCLSVRLC